VNDEAVEVAEDGTFSADVELIEGENTITVIAVLGEEQAQDSVTVTYTILEIPLSLEVTTNPLTVTGRVSDPEAAVTVNGIEAVVAEDGTFSAQVELVEGENVITVVAILDGKETSSSFIVTYSPPTVPVP
jgi:bacillopeptidase F